LKRKKQRAQEVDSLLETALQQVSSSLEASRRILGSFSQALAPKSESFESHLDPAVPKDSDP